MNSSRPRFSRHLKLVLPVTLAALALTLPRCGQTPTSSGPAAGTFTNVYSAIATSCNTCHVPGGSATVSGGSTIDFTTQATAYNTMVNQMVVSTVYAGTCGSLKIVNTTTPANSFLLAVLITADQTQGFGGATNCKASSDHSAGFVNLSQNELTTITSWVNAGAPNN